MLPIYRYRYILLFHLFKARICLFLLLVPLYALEGVCVRVSDGDTITIESAGHKEKVRLNGIDAPESTQPGGQEARQYLVERILNKQVRLEGSSRDRYGRLLGTVYLDSENINLAMIRAGWAWDYVSYHAGAEYTRAEKEARAARRGLWSKPAPLPPWEFRHPERYGHMARMAAEKGRPEAATALYWISNSGKTHNRRCKRFLDNFGTGYYGNTPGSLDAKCCGGAGR